MNKSEIEVPVATAYITKGMLGGIITPIEPAAADNAAAKPAEYPFLFMAGIINVPIADTVAGPEPDIAAKIMHDKVVTMARPPMINPTRLSAKERILFDIPPCSIKFPARIKNGIAISGKESSPVKAFCAIIIVGILLVKTSVSAVDNPRQIPIGTLSDIKKNKNKNKIIASII